MNDTLDLSVKHARSKFSQEGPNFRSQLERYWKNKNTEETTIHLQQINAVLSIRNMTESDPPTEPKPCIIVAPTGSGKSGIVAMLPYILESKKVLILTPSQIISNQVAEAFGSRQDRKNCFFKDANICTKIDWLSCFLENVTVINSSKDAVENEKITTNLVIVSAQKFNEKSLGSSLLSMQYKNGITVNNVETFFGQFDTLIVTEAHHYPADTWRILVEEFKKSSNDYRRKIVFLTATPYRIDNNGDRVHIFGNVRTACTFTKEMCLGWSIRKLDFNLNYGDERDFMHDISQILEKQEKLEPRFQPQALVLVSGNDEVLKTVEELNNSFGNDYAVGICGETTKHDVEGLKDFTDGYYRVAVICNVGLEGYDNTKVTLCVIKRKIVKSKIMFSRFVSRCLGIRRGLSKVNGEDIRDRSIGKVISYKNYEQESLWEDYKSMDDVISCVDPCDDDEEEENGRK